MRPSEPGAETANPAYRLELLERYATTARRNFYRAVKQYCDITKQLGEMELLLRS